MKEKQKGRFSGGFGMIPQTIRQISGINATDLALLTAIAVYANAETLESFASRETLMETAHIGSKDTFAKSKKRLIEAGVITVREKERNVDTGGYCSTIYKINWPSEKHEDGPKTGTM